MPTRFARLSARLRQTHARHLLLTSGFLVGLTLLVGTGLVLLDMRRQAVADAERELKNLSLVLAEDIDRGFQAAKLVQLGLIEHIRGLGIGSPEEFQRLMATPEVHRNLKERIGGLPNVEAVALIGANGRLLNVSRRWPTPDIDVADRDFFKLLSADGPSQTSFIGEPVRNRPDGTWTIVFARKVTTQDGRLLGLVNTGMQLAYFERSFSNISLNGGGSFSLLRHDGLLLARYPHVEHKVGIGIRRRPKVCGDSCIAGSQYG